jgi:hypothetical protein
MYPEPFYSSFGVVPNMLAMCIRVHLFMPKVAAEVADRIVLQGAIEAHSVNSARQRATAAESAQSQPKMGMSRANRRLLYRNNPELRM